MQGFPNSVKACGGIGNFAECELFYRVVGTSGDVLLTIQTFFKVKTAFHEYWASVKIKISMTCVYTVWNWNKKGTGAMTTAKMKFSLVYNIEIVI